MADPCNWLHHEAHEAGGCDEVSVAGLLGLLADPQTPLHHHESHASTGGDPINVYDLLGELREPQKTDVRKDGIAAGMQHTLNFIGAGVTVTESVSPVPMVNVNITSVALASDMEVSGSKACNAADTRLSNARTPTSHTHSPSADLVAGGTPGGTTFLRGDNVWAVPSGALGNNYGETFIPEPDSGAIGGATRYTHPSPNSIALAIAAAGPNNAIIKLVEGTYNIPATIKPKGRIILRGSGGRETTILKWTGAAPGPIIQNDPLPYDLHLSDFTIDGNGSATYGIDFSGGRLLAEGILARNCTIDGLKALATTVDVHKCEFRTNNNYGCNVTATSTARVIGCLTTGNGAGGYRGGLSVIIANCISVSDLGYGFYLSGIDDSAIIGCESRLNPIGARLGAGNACRGTTFRSSTGDAIVLDGDDSMVTGCQFNGTVGRNIYAAAQRRRLMITGNQSLNSGKENILLALAPEGCVISGNSFVGAINAFDGIRLEGDAKYNAINGNTILSGGGLVGIHLVGVGEDFNAVVGNVIKSGWGASLTLAGAGLGNQVGFNVL